MTKINCLEMVTWRRVGDWYEFIEKKREIPFSFNNFFFSSDIHHPAINRVEIKTFTGVGIVLQKQVAVSRK